MELKSLGLSQMRGHEHNARDGSRTSEVGELAASIRQHGLLQPLVVTPSGEGYRILAGHRRHSALKSLGMPECPCVVVDADEAAALAILISDNGQHQAVDPLRESDTLWRLVESLAGEGHPYDRAAALAGKSPAWVRDRLRLRNLGSAWRAAYADPTSPINEWPSAHLAVVAALPHAVQEQVLAENESAFRDGIPLAIELRRLLADFTRELSHVPWDLADGAVVEGTPACNDCPKRDVCEGFLFRAVTDTKKPRCLDALCFEAKKRATVLAAVTKAREKHGDKLAVEVSWGFDAGLVPEGTPTHREFELTPLAKSKGGIPVLRLKDMKIVFMGRASRTTDGRGASAPLDDKPAGPKSLEERRRDLDKRRLVRALTLLRGSLLGQTVEVGTERHPETITPPVLGLPTLPDLVALTVAFGTGRAVRDEGSADDDLPPWEQTDADRLTEALGLVRQGADTPVARERMWAVLRDPLGKLFAPVGGLTHEAVDRRAAVAKAVAGICGVDWEVAYVGPAVDAIPEPRVWAGLRAS